MRSLTIVSWPLAALLLVCAGRATAAEEKFELQDGRTVVGQRAGEEGDQILVKVQAGRAAATVRLAKSDIKAVSPVAAVPAPAPAAAPAVPPAPPPSAPPAAKKPTAKTDQAAAELRELLIEAVAEARHEASRRTVVTERLENPMPQELDPTYQDLYGPLAQGVYRENFKGLMYYQGVLPGAGRQFGGGWPHWRHHRGYYAPYAYYPSVSLFAATAWPWSWIGD